MPSLSSLAGKVRAAFGGKQQPGASSAPPGKAANGMTHGRSEDRAPLGVHAATSSLDTPPAYKPPMSPLQMDQERWGVAGHANGDAKKDKSMTSRIKSTFSGLTGLRSKPKEKRVPRGTAYSNRSGRSQEPASRQAARQPASLDDGKIDARPGNGTDAGSSAPLDSKRVRIHVAEQVSAMVSSARIALLCPCQSPILQGLMFFRASPACRGSLACAGFNMRARRRMQLKQPEAQQHGELSDDSADAPSLSHDPKFLVPSIYPFPEPSSRQQEFLKSPQSPVSSGFTYYAY